VLLVEYSGRFEDYVAFIIRVKVKVFDPSKYQEVITQGHSVTSQKT
jgi:hypothetical protein